MKFHYYCFLMASIYLAPHVPDGFGVFAGGFFLIIGAASYRKE